MQAKVHDQGNYLNPPRARDQFNSQAITLGPCLKSLKPRHPGMEHAGRMILHPNEAPLGLGSMEEDWIRVLGFEVRAEEEESSGLG